MSFQRTDTLNNLADIMVRGTETLVGELLREITFVGDGFGCYSTFDVRADATKWSLARRRDFWQGKCDDEYVDELASLGEGYTYRLGDITVDVCWYWDGDGVLEFVVYDSMGERVRHLANGDCKKDYVWRDES